ERRPDTPSYLAVAIDRALAKKPDDRFTDAAEFRDALDGANVRPPRSQPREERYEPVLPFQPAVPIPAPLPAAPEPFPAPPAGLSRRELRHWYRAQRRLALAQQLNQVGNVGLVMNDQVVWPKKFGSFDERPLEDRVISFRRSVVSWGVWSAIFFGINVAGNSHVPWFFLPSAFMMLDVLKKGGSIWS